MIYHLYYICKYQISYVHTYQELVVGTVSDSKKGELCFRKRTQRQESDTEYHTPENTLIPPDEDEWAEEAQRHEDIFPPKNMKRGSFRVAPRF